MNSLARQEGKPVMISIRVSYEDRGIVIVPGNTVRPSEEGPFEFQNEINTGNDQPLIGIPERDDENDGGLINNLLQLGDAPEQVDYDAESESASDRSSNVRSLKISTGNKNKAAGGNRKDNILIDTRANDEDNESVNSDDDSESSRIVNEIFDELERGG